MIYLTGTSLPSFTMAVIRLVHGNCWCVALCVCQDLIIHTVFQIKSKTWCGIGEKYRLLHLWFVLTPWRCFVTHSVTRTDTTLLWCVYTCSVSSTDALLYLWLVSVPSVASRSRKMKRAAPHTISSQLLSHSKNVWWLFSTYNHKTHDAYEPVFRNQSINGE